MLTLLNDSSDAPHHTVYMRQMYRCLDVEMSLQHIETRASRWPWYVTWQELWSMTVTWGETALISIILRIYKRSTWVSVPWFLDTLVETKKVNLWWLWMLVDSFWRIGLVDEMFMKISRLAGSSGSYWCNFCFIWVSVADFSCWDNNDLLVFGVSFWKK